jgi:cyclopropane fatty-acyl-phospholipid synthase-like methyltransferase
MDANTTIYEDGQYGANNPGWHAEDSPWKAGHVARLLKAHQITPLRLCEVGCGAGEILVNLAREYPAPSQFTGFEISPQAYEICRAKTTDRLQFSSTNPFDLQPSSAEPFDVALAIDVFEHVEDYFGFLRQMRGLAKYKVFHIPLDLSVQTVLRGTPLRKVREIVGHIHFFTKETALASLTHAGYRVVDWRYTANSLELPNRGWKANLGRLPRHLLSAFSLDLSVRVMGGYSILVLTT